MPYRRIYAFFLAVCCSGLLFVPEAAVGQFINAKEILSPLKRVADSLLKQKEGSITPEQVLNILDSNLPARAAIALPALKKGQPLSASALYKQSLSAVGLVAMCIKPNPLREVQLNHASGFVITPEGAFVTNYHVLYSYAHSRTSYGTGALLVRLGNGRVYAVNKVLAVSEQDDLAIVQLYVHGEKLPFVPMAAQDAAIGDPIYVLGNSERQLYSLTTGIVSDKYNETIGAPSGITSFNRNLLSITAEFSIGASGSPVLDNYGNLAGIVSSTYVVEQTNTGHAQSQMTIKNAIPFSSLQRLIM